ncbi:RNA binding protein, heterogenous nuclear RNP-K like protein [Tilletia horrida]|uniref:RNA binding protein, heterogenous nuclear RNP-K like protein n=1 Tax=Tilletia horrida TaxID=155126 RepID=A0AAN6GW14_9BASI|nr:RNA binding protein, heterogenous nuclear RNP-K like protein [Tilletia horrida]KAK0557580.1 RNA binding protein, heterogenous nuclear RNP-K like protein [Tilletia horrida]
MSDTNAIAPTHSSEDANKLSSPANDTAVNAGEAPAAESSTDAAEAGENGADGSGANSAAPVDPNAQLTIRALVSTKEAGVIIGKGGQNVAELREKTGVKAGVSKVVPGVHDRVLSVSGTMEGIAQAYSLIAQTILDNPITATPGATTPLQPSSGGQSTSVRLLISHNLMGTVIGRQGLKIKHIQDVSGARMVASKEMLPQSTERIVEVQGTTEAIRVAIKEIARCLLEDWERGQGTVLYHPNQTEGAGVLAAGGVGGLQMQGNRRASGAGGFLAGQLGSLSLGPGPLSGGGAGVGGVRRASQGASALNGAAPDFTMAPLANAFVPGALRGAGGARAGSLGGAGGIPLTVAPGGALDGAVVTPGGGLAAPGAPMGGAGAAGATAVDTANLRTQNISIPSDMVGCIIGKGGSKITEIRRVSGSRISIAKVAHDDTGERMFTIQGTAEANEKALFLLYSQLETEKERRQSTAQQGGGEGEESLATAA